jgi:hypothetical protein
VNEVEWKSMRTVPKKDKVKILGTTNTEHDELYEVEGYYDKELECFTTKSGWVIAAVAWRK